MKKTIFLVLVSLFIGGCGGIGCKGEPPRKAEFIEGGGYGMAYHFSIYSPSSGLSHDPTRCPQYEYAKIDLYVDDLGTVRGDRIIWKSLYGDLAFSDYGENPTNITVYFSDKKVIISGDLKGLTGTYKIETSSPSSWGVPIN